MATKNNGKQNGTNGNGSELSSELAAKIAGMRSVAPEYYAHRVEVDGKPNPIAGYLMGKKPVRYKDGREGAQFVLVTSTPCLLWNGDEGEAFEAPAGTAALVPERAALSELNRYLPTIENGEWRDVSEVVIQPLKKVALKGGKTMWKFAIYGKTVSAQQATVELLAAPATTTSNAMLLEAGHDSREEESQDEIPF